MRKGREEDEKGQVGYQTRMLVKQVNKGRLGGGGGGVGAVGAGGWGR